METMTREEILAFSEHLKVLCMNCRHTPERCYPSECRNNQCYLFPVRNLWAILRDRPTFVDQLLIKNTRTAPTQDTRVSNQVKI